MFTKSIISLSVFGSGIDSQMSARYELRLYLTIHPIFRKRSVCKKTLPCRIGSTCSSVSAIPFFPARCKDQRIVSVTEAFSSSLSPPQRSGTHPPIHIDMGSWRYGRGAGVHAVCNGFDAEIRLPTGSRPCLRVNCASAKQCAFWTTDPQCSPLGRQHPINYRFFTPFAGIFYQRISSAETV